MNVMTSPGLSSYLVGGENNGRVRLFEAGRHTVERITPHSHRFNFVCLVLEGEATNILFDRGDGDEYAIGKLTPANGGLGKYTKVHDVGRGRFVERATTYAHGDLYAMQAAEIHAIRFSRGARVLFFEGPPIVESSVFLEPCTEEDGRIPTFEVAPWMFRREASP